MSASGPGNSGLKFWECYVRGHGAKLQKCLCSTCYVSVKLSVEFQPSPVLHCEVACWGMDAEEMEEGVRGTLWDTWTSPQATRDQLKRKDLKQMSESGKKIIKAIGKQKNRLFASEGNLLF